MNTHISPKKHTFAICAYKDNKYLEKCIQSVICQSNYSEIIITTSTPNNYIESVATKYQIPVFINHKDHGITQDWNFAYQTAKTKYVTIVHQDDFYNSSFAELTINALDKSKHPLISFTDYFEYANGKYIKNSINFAIKRMLLFPLKFYGLNTNKHLRRIILSLGCSICCPSVTFCKDNLPSTIFKHNYYADEDWQAWEALSHLDGAYIYINKPLMYHRIHNESITSNALAQNTRYNEDYEMFRKFWSPAIAKILTQIYSISYRSNSKNIIKNNH